jgi:hypothetical protein
VRDIGKMIYDYLGIAVEEEITTRNYSVFTMISMNGSKFFHESTLGPLALTN